jgi:thiosulfate/3-mercaptopyruvate sulfurtransferase
MSTPGPGVLAALLALLLAIVVAVLDRAPASAPDRSASLDAAPAWAAWVESGADHLGAAELARLYLERPERLLLVDVRPAAEFEAFHLPGSRNLDLVRLLGPEGTALLDAHADRTVVLVSNGMTHPAQAWTELARRGRTNVRILEEGLEGLKSTLLTPPSLRGPTTEARAAADAPLFAALAAKVLGRPAASPAGPRAGRYASDPLALTEPTVVSTAWVAARLGRIAVLDTREKAKDYAQGHLPGAVHAPIEATRAVRGDVGDELLAPEALAARAGSWGLTPESEVVLYGGDRLQDPTHLALALVALGHRRVALMEGGLGAWRREGRPTSTDAVVPVAASYAARSGAFDFGVGIDAVIAASRGEGPPLLDVRPTAAFEGEKGTEARGGRIPRSRSRPYTEDVVVEEGAVWWRAREDLLAGYRALGLDPAAPVIVSCRTGHQASQTWFTLRVLLGWRDVRWYDGSWKEWALRNDLPAEAGPAAREAR